MKNTLYYIIYIDVKVNVFIVNMTEHYYQKKIHNKRNFPWVSFTNTGVGGVITCTADSH